MSTSTKCSGSVLDEITRDVDAQAGRLCWKCGICHHYDFCPRCGEPSDFFAAEAVNGREHNELEP